MPWILPMWLRPIAESLTDQSLPPARGALLLDRSRQNRYHGRATRRPSGISTVLIHQTGCEFGVASYQIRNAGGDRNLAYLQRFDALPYHLIVTRRGDLIQANHPLTYTPHAGQANKTSIGFSIEGRFPAFARDRDPKKHTAITPDLIAAWRSGFVACVREARAVGCPIRYVETHRQWSTRRAADPGEEIMRHVVLPLIGPLDLVLTEGSRGGSANPSEWLP